MRSNTHIENKALTTEEITFSASIRNLNFSSNNYELNWIPNCDHKIVRIGPEFQMTLKTKLFLWLHEKFNRLAQWFINHCDFIEDSASEGEWIAYQEI